ncbi:MAG TPA: TIR domain-containing protein, partial [Chthoniobacteraceae bacterium]|nr:TIR domain-containing protein [Chthoniobacteraceae bacterium]
MAAPSKYYAFISYSRKDSKAAAWLQRRLEWFRFPVKLVPQDRRPPNARYVRPIYRDKTNLEVTDEHYWANLRRALEESRFLIVLCSPHAAASEPVNLEVAHFLQSHGGEASLVVPIIVRGNVTGAGADAAFCPALRALGDTLISRNLPTMVPDAVTAEQDAWEHGFVSLVSYLLRLERTALGDHIQRETKRQTRVLQRWLVAVGMLTVIAGVLGLLTFKAKREVEQANTVIVEKNASNLKNLHEASMADYAVAVQRIEKDRKWHEGVAHLARALKWEPGNLLAAARLYSTLSLYGPEKQTWPRGILRHAGEILDAQFSPDGTRVVTASRDNTARVWDAVTGQPMGEPLRHEGAVTSAQFSPDGTRLVTASWDKTARVWDAATGRALGEPLRHEGFVESAQFSPDGTRIVSACDDKTVRVWEAATGRALGEPLRHEEKVQSAQFSPDGTCIVTATGDLLSSKGEARLWDAGTGKSLGKPMAHEGNVMSVKFSPDGARIVTASQDQTARVWDAATGNALGEPMRHEGGVESAQFSPDGTRILTASLDQTLRVWDAATGR